MTDTVRYRPDASIDTGNILEITGLASTQWGPIEQAYPEVRAAGQTASFRRASKVTIYPPRSATLERLHTLLGMRALFHVVYRFPADMESDLISVMVQGLGSNAVIHIYRLRPAE